MQARRMLAATRPRARKDRVAILVFPSYPSQFWRRENKKEGTKKGLCSKPQVAEVLAVCMPVTCQEDLLACYNHVGKQSYQ
jgi:hypothetical protein